MHRAPTDVARTDDAGAECQFRRLMAGSLATITGKLKATGGGLFDNSW